MTRSSSSRKQKSGKIHSKLSIMRKKLTLRSRISPVQITQDIKHEEKEHGVEAKDKKSEVKHNVDPERSVVLSQAKANETFKAKSNKAFQRASPIKLVRLYPNITSDQQKMIREADYGGLLDIKCSKLRPDLCKFLMKSFDPVTCHMVFPRRGSIPVTEVSVQKVIGVPRGRIEMQYTTNAEATRFMREQLGNGVRRQPTVTSLEEKLVSMKKADSKYLRLFITYGLCSVLAPTTGTRISPRLYPSMINIKQAKKLNICKFVIMIICKATKSGAEKGILKSCMLYLMVKYLDSLQLEGVEVSEEGTRVSVWTNEMVKKAILQDTWSNGRFGKAKLKPEFANNETTCEPLQDEEPPVHSKQERNFTQVDEENDSEDNVVHDSGAEDGEEIEEEAEELSILFSDHKIDKFIQKHAPANCTHEDTERYREAVEEACMGFEAGLQKLLTKLTTRPVKKKKARKRRAKKSEQKSECDLEHNRVDPPTATEKEKVGDEEDVETHTEPCIKTSQVTSDEGPKAFVLVDNEGATCVQQTTMEQVIEPKITVPVERHTVGLEIPYVHVSAPSLIHDGTEQNRRAKEDGTMEQDGTKQQQQQEIEDKKLKTHCKETVMMEQIKLPVLDHQKTNDRENSVDFNQDGYDGFLGEFSDSAFEAKKRDEEILQYALSSPPRPKFCMQQFEEPVFLDIGVGMSSNKSMLQELVNKLPRMNMDDAQAGLTNLLDGTLNPETAKLLKEMEPKPIRSKRKAVSFAEQQMKRSKNQPNTNTPSPSRYRTRSVVREEIALSPNKAPVDRVANMPLEISTEKKNTPSRKSGQQGSPTDSLTQRVTRSFAKEVQSAGNQNTGCKPLSEDNSAPKTTTSSIPSSAEYDPFRMRLNFDSTESERRIKAASLAPDAPPFDLDTPPEDNVQDGQVAAAGQQGCNKGFVGPSGTSITPVHHEYEKRVVKQGKFASSPYVNYETQKSYIATKSQEELYNMVCEHGWKSGSNTNTEVVIDVGNYYVSLGNLAESVAPGKKLINTVVELAIFIITMENLDPTKTIMPLRVAKYLTEGRFNLKDVVRCFENNENNRLDRKDIVCFPTLEKFSNLPQDSSGHYFLVVLNIKAERFEIVDSLARNGKALMMEACHLLIAGIKTMWKRMYKDSKVQITNFPIEVIPNPKQENTFDCGFFTLKNLEERHGRRMPSYTQKDLPNIRKIYTDKWLRWNNKVQWQLLV